MAILASVTPLVEQLSIDEAFLDVSGARRLLGTGTEIAALDPRAACAPRPASSRRSASRPRSSSPSSRATSPSPTACSSVAPGTERAFLAPLPVSRLWGVGPATFAAARAHRRAHDRRGRRAARSRRSSPRSATSLGTHLHALAHNDDPRAVVPEREAKSIGAEETFAVDLHEPRRVRPRARAPRRSRRAPGCARAELEARTVTLKIRFGNFETKTRARTAPDRHRREHRVPGDRARAARRARLRTRRPPARRLAVAARAAPAAAQGVLALDDDGLAGRRRASSAAPRSSTRSTRCATASVHRRSARRRSSSREPARREPVVMRIGLVGCGHIGTVHAYALQQLTDARLIDAALDRAPTTPTRRAPRTVARHHGGEPAAIARRARRRRRRRVGLHVDRRAPRSGRGRGRRRARRCSARSRSAPTSRRRERVAARARARAAPGRARAALRRRCSRTRPRSSRAASTAGRWRPSLRDDQYFPIQGFYGSTWRKDVAQAGGGTLIEHSIHDIDVLHWLLGDPGRRSARAPRRASASRASRTPRRSRSRFADGSVAQLTSVWHQVLTRESGRHLEVFCEGAALWTDDDYLGPLHVQTSDGTREVHRRAARVGRAADRARGVRQVDRPLRRRRRRRSSTGSPPVPRRARSGFARRRGGARRAPARRPGLPLRGRRRRSGTVNLVNGRIRPRSTERPVCGARVVGLAGVRENDAGPAEPRILYRAAP